MPRGPRPPDVRVAYSRVMPGLAYALDASIPRLPVHRLLMSLVVASEDDPLSADLVVGFLSVEAARVAFRQTGRARIPRATGEGITEIYESVPVAWHPGLGRWIVMLTVGQFWEGRFHLVDRAGRLYRGRSGALPVSTWWPPQAELSHSGNVVHVHPRTGTVMFQTAHNTASGTVSIDNEFVNQWAGIYRSDDSEQPPDTFSQEANGLVVSRSGARWYVAPVLDDYWEWQASGLGVRLLGPPTVALDGRGAAVAVSAEVGEGGGDNGVISTALFSRSSDDAALFFGVHRVMSARSNRSAHVALWSPPGSTRVSIGVAFTEDDRGGG